MKEGDIVLVRSRWGLRWFVRYDHSALMLKLRGEWCTLEAGILRGVEDWFLFPNHWKRPYDVYRVVGDLGISAEDAVHFGWLRKGERYAIEWLPEVLRRAMAAWIRRQRGYAWAAKTVCTSFVADCWMLPVSGAPAPDELLPFLQLVHKVENREDEECLLSVVI